MAQEFDNEVTDTIQEPKQEGKKVSWRLVLFLSVLLIVLGTVKSCFGGKEEGKQTEGEQQGASLIENIAPSQGPTVVREVKWTIGLEPFEVDLQPREFLRVKKGQIVQNSETLPFSPDNGGYEEGGEWIPGPRKVAESAKGEVPCPDCDWIKPVIQGNRILGLNVRPAHLGKWGEGEEIIFEVMEP